MIGSFSVSTVITTTTTTTTATASATTAVIEPSGIANSCARNPNSTTCLMTDDKTGNDTVRMLLCRLAQ